MNDIDKLEELIKKEINNNIKLYGNHNIYLIDIKKICNKHNIDFEDICITIGNVDYIRRKYYNYYYLLVSLQIYVLIRNENDDIDNRFYEKLSEITGIYKDDLQNKIIPAIQKDIWAKFYKDMKAQKIYINEWQDRKGAHRYVMFPKSQVVYRIGKIKKILQSLSPYHEYTKQDIKKIIKEDNRTFNGNEIECGTEQVYAYYKIHGISEETERKIENKEKNTREINKTTERIRLLYNQFEEKPIIYIENDENAEEINTNQLIAKVKDKNIIFFRKINYWEYEYSKYFYDEDFKDYAVIISKRFYNNLGDNKVKLDEKYYFIPSLSIELQTLIYRNDDENKPVIYDKDEHIIISGGIKAGRNKWIQGYGPMIKTNYKIYINGEKQPLNYLKTCKSGEYIIRTKNETINIEIIDEDINQEEYYGWKIDKEEIIPSSIDYNIKGMDILIEDEENNKENYAKNVFNTYSGFNICKGENKWIMKYWDM